MKLTSERPSEIDLSLLAVAMLSILSSFPQLIINHLLCEIVPGWRQLATSSTTSGILWSTLKLCYMYIVSCSASE